MQGMQSQSLIRASENAARAFSTTRSRGPDVAALASAGVVVTLAPRCRRCSRDERFERVEVDVSHNPLLHLEKGHRVYHYMRVPRSAR